MFVLPPLSNLDAIFELSQSIQRGTDIPLEMNAKISNLLGVPLYDYVSTMDGALRLRDIIYADHSYLCLEMREYNDSRGLVFLTKIENEYGSAEGDHHTREGALIDALLSHVVYEMESE